MLFRSVVIYMGIGALPQICEQLIAHGMPASTPAAVIERGTTRTQRVIEATAGTLADWPATLDERLTQADESVDGILCWDVFDFLDRPAAQALARRLVRMLKPDGVLLGYFANGAPAPDAPRRFTKYVVVDRGQLEYRGYASSDRKSTRLNSSHIPLSRMPSSA